MKRSLVLLIPLALGGLAACGSTAAKAVTAQPVTTTAPALTTTIPPTTTTALPGAFTTDDFEGKCNNLQANFTMKIAGSKAVRLTAVVTYSNSGTPLATQGRSAEVVLHPAKVNHVVVTTPYGLGTFDSCSLDVTGMTYVPNAPVAVSRDTKLAITKCLDGSVNYGTDMILDGPDDPQVTAVESDCDDAAQQAKVDGANQVAQAIAAGQARMAHLKLDAVLGTHADSPAQAATDLDTWTAEINEMVGLS